MKTNEITISANMSDTLSIKKAMKQKFDLECKGYEQIRQICGFNSWQAVYRLIK